MAKERHFTKRQHYVPQVYLRGFSENENIYFYDIKKRKHSDIAVPVKSILFEECIYEFKNEDGKYLAPNYLEGVLGEFEKLFSKNRELLNKLSREEDNYNINYLLHGDEKAFWVSYIAIQLMRRPQIIKMCEEYSEAYFGDKLSDVDIKNFALKTCLPFLKEIEVGDISSQALFNIIEPMMNMSFVIGVDDTDSIITSDSPVHIEITNYPCKEYDLVIFPISSRLCLFMHGNKYANETGKMNCLFKMQEDEVTFVNERMVLSSKEKILSKEKFYGKKLKHINQILDARDIEGDNKKQIIKLMEK